MITTRQKELLDFLRQYSAEYGYAPNFDEMMAHLGLKSKSGVHRLLEALIERGHIRKLPNRARAIEVVEQDIQQESSDSAMIQIPMIGQIAAGLPLEAIADAQEYVELPPNWISAGTQYYGLTVVGDSMCEAGILDGDTAIIESTNAVRQGDIVVALIDQSDVTLKTYRPKNDAVALEPANKEFQTQIYAKNRVTIQGKLARILRQY